MTPPYDVDHFIDELKKIVGPGWIDAAPLEDIEYFISWAAKTGVYLPVTSKTGHAFRGFIKACEIKRDIKDREK